MTAAHRTSLDKIKLTFLECHKFGHAWEWVRDEQITTNTKGAVISYIEIVKCLRCQAFRRGLFAVPSNDLLGSYTYDVPEGYYLQLPDTGTRISRAEVRAESARRRNRRFRALTGD
jgi:hypothetical protein